MLSIAVMSLIKNKKIGSLIVGLLIDMTTILVKDEGRGLVYRLAICLCEEKKITGKRNDEKQPTKIGLWNMGNFN